MHVERTEAGFQPVTITLESETEAKVLKLLCTTTAEDAVLGKPRDRALTVTEDEVRAISASIFNALKAQDIKYLEPR